MKPELSLTEKISAWLALAPEKNAPELPSILTKSEWRKINSLLSETGLKPLNLSGRIKLTERIAKGVNGMNAKQIIMYALES